MHDDGSVMLGNSSVHAVHAAICETLYLRTY